MFEDLLELYEVKLEDTHVRPWIARILSKIQIFEVYFTPGLSMDSFKNPTANLLQQFGQL